MDAGILVPIGLFTMIAAIVIVPNYLRVRERQEMQATVRTAIEKGQPLPPELVDALSKDVRSRTVSSAHRDMRIGVILLFVAGGVALTAIALGQISYHAMYGTLAGSAVPGMIGLAFVILSFFNPNKRPPQA